MLEWALQCARQGLRVHPLYEVDEDLVCRCWRREKCEEKQRGKHPRLNEWQKQASADVEQVTRWWTQWPAAGIGVATGEQSRVWVLDLDGDAAIEWYKEQCRTHGMVKTIGARTGRGRHLWWEWTGADIGCNKDVPVKGVDVRGNGGFIIVPPTLHRSGVRYEWLTTGAYIDHPAMPPQWLVDAVKRPPPKPLPKMISVPSRVPWSAKAADEELARRLRLDPGARAVLAERLGTVTEQHARKVKCPQCGDRSVWWMIHGTGYAKCSHLNSCGWMGPLTALLGA